MVCTLEDTIDVARRAPIVIDLVIAVGQQPAEFRVVTEWMDDRETGAARDITADYGWP